jgi:hypothetical protein
MATTKAEVIAIRAATLAAVVTMAGLGVAVATHSSEPTKTAMPSPCLAVKPNTQTPFSPACYW